MTKLLHVSSSPDPNSFSRKVANRLLEKLNSPELEITNRDLAQEPPSHNDNLKFSIYGTPEDQLNDEQTEMNELSKQYITEVEDSDILVISTPMHNFGIPSTLKAWIDSVVRAGKTFTYTNTGPKGLLEDKKVYIVMASGAIYTTEEGSNDRFVVPYLKQILGFIGLTNVSVIRIEGTRMSQDLEDLLIRAYERVDALDV